MHWSSVWFKVPCYGAEVNPYFPRFENVMNCVYAIENIAGVVKEEYGYDVKGAGPESVILPVIVNRSSVGQRAGIFIFKATKYF